MSFVVFMNGLILIAGGLLALADAVIFPETEDAFLSAGFVLTSLGIFVALAASANLKLAGRLQAFVLTA